MQKVQNRSMPIKNSDPMKCESGGGTDRAVSPVIGVILMVAITVILAAVIGVFVMGLGDEIGDTAPTATVDFDDSTNADEVIVLHENGDTLALDDEFSILVDGSAADDPWSDNEELSAGESTPATIDSAVLSGDGDYEIQLRHDPSGSIIGSGEVTIDDSNDP